MLKMNIRDIILSLLEVDLTKLNEAVNKLFVELQAEYNDNTNYIEQCGNFMPVLELCKAISLRADAIQEMDKAAKIFTEFLKCEGINMEDLKNNDNN